MNTDTTRQFWIRSPGHGEIVAAPLPPGQEGEVLVRTLFTGISRGTEALVFLGRVPESQYEVMRAPFQEGDFPGPVKYGYANVGEVLEGPPELLGRVVFCLYPHQDLFRVPASAVTPLPAAIPAERAILAANVETALNAVWDAQPGPGDRIVVVGAGVVGLLSAWLCSGIPGTEVVAIDLDAGRAAVAAALGVAFTADSSPRAVMEALGLQGGADPSAGVGADLVIHASGSAEGLRTALSLTGPEATVLELSWYGDREVTLPLGEAFHSDRLTLKSSQVGSIPPHRAPRWSYRRRMAVALGLLADARLDHLISGESDFDELPHVMDRLSRDPAGALCHRIRYPSVPLPQRA